LMLSQVEQKKMVGKRISSLVNNFKINIFENYF
jgi:hypothetical protein